jgi:fructokinase
MGYFQYRVNNMTATNLPSPVIYGEVLFDEFEDGSAVLGGAPFNVAWHLHGLGAAPLFISRIGHDESGNKILSNMKSWSMDTHGIQQDEQHATGTVSVKLSNGQPAFRILPDVAYDHINLDEAEKTIGKNPTGIFYHGSLIARGGVSRKTLKALRQNLNMSVFMDINLRPECWTLDQVDELLQGTRWLKINDQELGVIAEGLNFSTQSLEDMAQNLQDHYGIEAIIVTLGEKGAFITSKEQGVIKVDPAPVKNVIDTVGAGDAFSAVTILGLLRGWDFKKTLESAVIFAAAVCEQRGATIQNPDFYTNYKQNMDL